MSRRKSTELVLLYRLGAGLVAACMVVGLVYSLASRGQLPPLEIDYGEEITELLDRRDYRAALPLIRQAAEIDFNSEYYYQKLAETARATGDLENQIFALKALTQFNRQRADVPYTLASIYVDLGDYEQAVHFARIAVDRAPREANCRNVLGAALLGAGRKEEAALQYRTALQLDPQSEPARRALEYALPGY